MKFDHRFQIKESGASNRVYTADGVTARVDFIDHMLRGAITRDDAPLLPTWSVCPAGEDVPPEGRNKRSTEGFALVSPDVTETDETERLTLFTCAEHGTRRFVCKCELKEPAEPEGKEETQVESTGRQNTKRKAVEKEGE